MKQVTNTDHEFAYGSGHINPVKAVHPGLVYDAGEKDYVAMLCNSGYDNKTLRMVTGDKSGCPTKKGSVLDLNYPSMAVTVNGDVEFSATFKRTVTNVGSPKSTYQATVQSLPALQVSVNPSVLSFRATGEKKSFVVTVKGKGSVNVSSASLVWKDGVHQVRSPIVVHPA